MVHYILMVCANYKITKFCKSSEIGVIVKLFNVYITRDQEVLSCLTSELAVKQNMFIALDCATGKYNIWMVYRTVFQKMSNAYVSGLAIGEERCMYSHCS